MKQLISICIVLIGLNAYPQCPSTYGFLEAHPSQRVQAIIKGFKSEAEVYDSSKIFYTREKFTSRSAFTKLFQVCHPESIELTDSSQFLAGINDAGNSIDKEPIGRLYLSVKSGPEHSFLIKEEKLTFENSKLCVSINGEETQKNCHEISKNRFSKDALVIINHPYEFESKFKNEDEAMTYLKNVKSTLKMKSGMIFVNNSFASQGINVIPGFKDVLGVGPLDNFAVTISSVVKEFFSTALKVTPYVNTLIVPTELLIKFKIPLNNGYLYIFNGQHEELLLVKQTDLSKSNVPRQASPLRD